jgi:hypothetical protein
MRQARLKRGIELGILMDVLLVAYRDKDKRDLIPKIENKIAQKLEDVGLSFEEVDCFIRTLRRWIREILEKEELEKNKKI